MSNLLNRFFASIFLFGLLYVSIYSIKILAILLIIIFYQAFYEFYEILKKMKMKNNLILLNLILFLIYLLIFILLIWKPFITNTHDVIKNILFILLVCISTDIGGYMFGKLMKGKKLTKISPNKTYWGLFGSYIFSLITVFLIFRSYFEYDNIFILIIVISTISQLGDLFISFLKRKASIKDTGKFLPGHGGILDRIDGIIFAIPSGLLIIKLL